MGVYDTIIGIPMADHPNTKTLLDSPKIVRGGFTGQSPIYAFKAEKKIQSVATRRRKKLPCNEPTGFTYNVTTYNPQSYETSLKYGPADWVYGPSGPIHQYDSGDGSLQLYRARAKLAGSEVNLGETLVEFGETVQLFNSGLSRLYRGFSALKEGKFGKALSIMGDSSRSQSVLRKLPASKRLSNGYLELQFGWLPIMSDIHTAVEVYSKGIIQKGDIVRKTSGQGFGFLDKAINDFSKVYEPESRATVSGVVRNEAVLAAQLNSLGLLNPLLMAWNKLPFSFLIDWFVPVSTVLGALTASAGLSCYSQTVTRVNGVDQHTSGQETIWFRNFRGVRRSVVGLPALSLERGVALSLGQGITSIALLRSLL